MEMDKNCVFISGIETNNLKNIDITLYKNSINLILGPSGSGKSSLAYDTIAQIGQHELLSMFADNISEPNYRVKSYHNMLAAVPIKQSNFNNNIRSTIGTYFGLNQYISLIYAISLGLNEQFFVLNKESNLCKNCHGIGFISKIDLNKVIDFNVKLENNPVRSWNRYKDFYKQIISDFCNDNCIDSKKTFKQLTENEKKQFLYGESCNKYSIRYKKTGSFSRRTTKYYGIMTGKPMIPNHSVSKQFYSDVECDCCKGKRYSTLHDQYKINGLSIGEFMTVPFSELYLFVENLINKNNNQKISFALRRIAYFIKMANEHNLGHLFFNRSIPTLSGGELQRLKMVQVFNAQLSDLLIVLDEPLAGLSGNELHSVYKNIINLSKNHTLVIVDHSDVFLKDAKNIITLGESGGNNGGNIINTNNYLCKENEQYIFDKSLNDGYINVSLNSKIYNYRGVNVSFAKKSLNIITGSSGVGKSTLLREYLPQILDKYIYINQKPLSGNKNSSVATVLEIFSNISTLYARKYKKDKKFFSNLTGNDGACPICGGAGYLEYGDNYNSKIHLECKECEGTGFNKILKKYKLNGKSIFDIWQMTIDNAIDFFEFLDEKITKKLNLASSIMLGHLKIGQLTSTLSGGENIRIKILKVSKTTAQILGIDEPFRGLSNSEIYKIALYLDQLRKQGKTIIVIDHSENAIKYFSYYLELKNDDFILNGELLEQI